MIFGKRKSYIVYVNGYQTKNVIHDESKLAPIIKRFKQVGDKDDELVIWESCKNGKLRIHTKIIIKRKKKGGRFVK